MSMKLWNKVFSMPYVFYENFGNIEFGGTHALFIKAFSCRCQHYSDRARRSLGEDGR